jgi:hypothetical protein
MWWRSLRREEPHQWLLLNNQGSKFNMRWMRKSNMQEVSSWMQEGHTSRVELETWPVTSATQGWTEEVKNSSSSPKAISNMRRSKSSRPLTMLLILMLMLLMSLICHIMILMLMCLWEISLVKSLPCMLDHTTRGQRLVCGWPSALLLTWEDPIKLGYLRRKPKLVL